MSGWVAGAIVVGAVVGAYSQHEASKKQQQGIENASRTQAQTAEQQLAELRRQYDQLRTDLQPYRQIGTSAAQQLNDLLAGKIQSR